MWTETSPYEWKFVVRLSYEFLKGSARVMEFIRSGQKIAVINVHVQQQPNVLTGNVYVRPSKIERWHSVSRKIFPQNRPYINGRSKCDQLWLRLKLKCSNEVSIVLLFCNSLLEQFNSMITFAFVAWQEEGNFVKNKVFFFFFFLNIVQRKSFFYSKSIGQ